MQLDFSNFSDQKELRALTRRLVKRTLNFLKAQKIIDEQEVQLSLALIDPEQIKQINKTYRQKEETTDVLSFVYEKMPELIEGEILFCLEQIKANATEDKIAWQKEFSKNVIHGILHIVGFEHGKQMFALQSALLKSCLIDENAKTK